MNQINFEREFDERLDVTFGAYFEIINALKNIPTEDQHDSETVWLDTATGKLKVSGA
ncbi:MAG: hypothetical protein JW912_07600 [Sedimentisphaerales bacterium]|nr:hypothetical protein [Sedimentisphaerales bacterium]